MFPYSMPNPRVSLLHLLVLGLPAAAGAQSSAPPAAPPVLDTVQVTADAYDAQAERQNSATGKTVVDRAELEKFDAATIGEILRRLPGVSLAADSEGGRRGRDRAEDRLAPRIVVDGEPLPGGNRNALRLPVELIERIEIIRNSTPEFPAGQGGTINLILRDTPVKKAGTYRVGLSHDGEAFGGRAGGSYGDREGESGLIVMGFADTRPTQGDRTVSRETFAGGARSAWDIETDQDRGRDSGLHTFARITRDLGGGQRLLINPMLMLRDIERTSHTRLQNYLDPVNGLGLTDSGWQHEDETGQRAHARLSLEWKARRAGQGESSLQFIAQAGGENRTRRETDTDAAGAVTATGRTEDTQRGSEFTLKGKHGLVLADAHVVTLGLDARVRDSREWRRQFANGVDVTPVAQARTTASESQLALWAQDEWQLADAHVLTPGLRVQTGERAVTDGTGVESSDSRTAWLPSLAYLWQLNPRWNLRANVARSQALPPALRDLSPVVRQADGVNSLGNPDRGGNPDLRPETATAWQAGIEHFLPDKRGSAGLTVTWRTIDDAIQRQIALESGRFVERPVNVGGATEAGVLADFKWKLADLPALTLRGNAGWNRLEFDTAGVRQETPRRTASLGADYDWAAQKMGLGATLSFSSAFTREASPSLVQTQRARTQLDVYATKKLDRALTARLSVDNLTRARRGDDSVQYAGGVLTERDTDRAAGVRVVNLSLEGKF